jgi:hypothetical protein
MLETRTNRQFKYILGLKLKCGNADSWTKYYPFFNLFINYIKNYSKNIWLETVYYKKKKIVNY